MLNTNYEVRPAKPNKFKVTHHLFIDGCRYPLFKNGCPDEVSDALEHHYTKISNAKKLTHEIVTDSGRYSCD